MSNLIPTTSGETVVLNKFRDFVNGLIPANLAVKLFQNNYTPVVTTTPASLTEATFTGYSSKALTNPFGAVRINSGNNAEMDSIDLLNWTAQNAASPNTIYGYWVMDTQANTLLWVERFATPANMTAAGKKLNLLLRYGVGGGTSCTDGGGEITVGQDIGCKLTRDGSVPQVIGTGTFNTQVTSWINTYDTDSMTLVANSITFTHGGKYLIECQLSLAVANVAVGTIQQAQFHFLINGLETGPLSRETKFFPFQTGNGYTMSVEADFEWNFTAGDVLTVLLDNTSPTATLTVSKSSWSARKVDAAGK